MATETFGYEVMVIFKPLLPDEVRKEAHKTIIDLAKKLGGEMVAADVWGKRYLAYPIKTHDEGYYIVYEVKLPRESVEEFGVNISRIPEILRYLVTRIDDPAKVRKKLNKKVIDI